MKGSYIQVQCEHCGFIYNDKLSGLETKCPECGFREFIGEIPPAKKRGESRKCLTCPFSLDVCQECEEAVSWDTEVAPQVIPTKVSVPSSPSVATRQSPSVKEVQPSSLRLAEGEVRVFIKWIGTWLTLPDYNYRFFKFMYSGTAILPDGSRVKREFRDEGWIKPGWYALPLEEWGPGSSQFIAECDACGTQYDAMGSVGTKLECPMCGTEDVIEAFVEEEDSEVA